MFDRDLLPPYVTDEMVERRLKTDHEKNLEYFAKYYPELLDYYILAYENIIDYKGGFLEPEDVYYIAVQIRDLERNIDLELS